MRTLLQTLLLQTLSTDTDPILRSYIETVLPALEREFSLATALGGSETAHYQVLSLLGDQYAKDKAQKWSQSSDQSLMVHVLNALLTSWNLIPHLNSVNLNSANLNSANLNPANLNPANSLSEIEKRLLCLGITLHDYDKHCRSQVIQPPSSDNIPKILKICEELGEKLNFSLFWSEWRNYLLDIAFLAQNTQFKHGTNIIPANWLTSGYKFAINDSRRLTSPLRHLLAFGDIAVHLTDPGDIDTETGGDRLREHLRFLNINKKLVYHRLRDTVGILTNGIHNATIQFAKELDWEPILFFAQGVVYLAPNDNQTPDNVELQEFIYSQISGLLSSKMLRGEVGFKRDGKGLKAAPQTLELLTAAEIIRELPLIIAVKVANQKDPATPKRLAKLSLTESEQKFLAKGADFRADRIAEFILFAEKELLRKSPKYITWILDNLKLTNKILPEQTQLEKGGVNYGWYQAAAYYIAENSALIPEEITDKLLEIAEKLAEWAENNDLLAQHHNVTKEVLQEYLSKYLEVKGWESEESSFLSELAGYTIAKTKVAKQPICSLSSGEFISEDQMDSVVLFKPQQYSNKNSLGGGKIKRGISKIWSLEMLLRQALWGVPAGKLEEQQPIYLYIFPAYVYSPQTATAIKLLVNNIKRLNMREICKQWVSSGMSNDGLQNLNWLLDDEIESGRYHKNQQKDKYAGEDLPFMAMTYTKTLDKTLTDAWVKPAFLAITLPILLGVKVVATSSSFPLYKNDSDFKESVILDGPAGFWNLLGLSTSLRIQDLQKAIQKLLIAYSLNLDTRSSSKDPKWRDLIKTVREITTNVLNIFALANQGLRRNDSKRNPTSEEIQRYWKYAQIWVGNDDNNHESCRDIPWNVSTEDISQTNNTYQNKSGGKYLMQLMTKLVKQYRTFYQVKLGESSHTILLPLSKALEVILSVPQQIDCEDIILQGAGQLKDALERQEVYKRPLIADKSIDYTTRQAQEIAAIHTFMTTCVKELFLQLYQGDRALLQENRNRIKSGVEFAYRRLALQEKSPSINSDCS
ncbi:type I-D CRISPR-associated protein Cas10d/Csc3 [Mastigocoleus testarum]|uniref:Type I-D CRISPR-associated protein Cas10d/Csc3 n=1 Tax=Mastigocoleus testarum BC008 TaxID=371196 RepID=A0A0V7ZQK8_9CYAN|nr:type I-D CRISPR-associated protein Cas10d/Csc3 [Mastigocoleus testarum]KST66746.1 type I-D CRISPR-associated protein Cas10d/Csc3 [Mastigocoleus testarum BC008]